MAVETETTRATMLADFGETVSGPTGVSDFKAILNRREDDDTFDADAKVWSFDCRTSDITALSEGDTVTVSGQSYRVQIIDPDDLGMSQFLAVAL